MSKHWLFILSLLFLALPVSAQKRRASQLTPEQKAHKERMERMTANTQRIMFVDSMVVDRQQFIQYYRLSPEAGSIARFQDFFHTSQQPNAYVYVNELGNQCLMAQEAPDSTITLYSSQNIDNSWTRPEPLHGINDQQEFRILNYPFMLGDGQTFYFAAKGGDSLGGYDIYVTRYNSEDNQFLHPVNIGMPFNSEANDYMYIIDEFSNLGWFATDRNQPDDKVCIYVFIPSQTRQTYSASGLQAGEIASFARIDRIADTWTDSIARDKALKRLHDITLRKTHEQPIADFHFVINDEVTYTRLTDFKAPDNNRRYQQLTTLQSRYYRLVSTLTRARDYYAGANQDERNELRPEILSSEQKQHELYNEIRQLEKTIRNTENIFLTKNKQ